VAGWLNYIKASGLSKCSISMCWYQCGVMIGSADYVWTENWQTFNGHGYKFFYDKHSSANEADRLCRAMGAMLVNHSHGG